MNIRFEEAGVEYDWILGNTNWFCGCSLGKQARLLGSEEYFVKTGDVRMINGMLFYAACVSGGTLSRRFIKWDLVNRSDKNIAKFKSSLIA